MPGTVAIIKVNGTNEILGGYNPLVWMSNYKLKWSKTTDGFIFSLKPQNLPNSILSRIIHANKVIGCCSYYCPVFGNNFGILGDIKQWYYVHIGAYFEKRLRSDNQNLLIDEFEVFQVLKN
ncbi:hypothetical protein C2G38_2157045 [Gigaspora rosea]|uniref:TLDc domain-containing protein n=1 Tax=Gigaspora rosea TaxID=44941 RepID=A0A397W3Z7_9GLOM|nr:hypothetical protein C2G38_2157045 [Gigaspora rosea]